MFQQYHWEIFYTWMREFEEGFTWNKWPCYILFFLLQNELMQHFHKGRRDRFFKEWNDSLHPSVRDGDAVAKKLEFYLNIYFAIFPIKFARGQVIHFFFKSSCIHVYVNIKMKVYQFMCFLKFCISMIKVIWILIFHL